MSGHQSSWSGGVGANDSSKNPWYPMDPNDGPTDPGWTSDPSAQGFTSDYPTGMMNVGGGQAPANQSWFGGSSEPARARPNFFMPSTVPEPTTGDGVSGTTPDTEPPLLEGSLRFTLIHNLLPTLTILYCVLPNSRTRDQFRTHQGEGSCDCFILISLARILEL